MVAYQLASLFVLSVKFIHIASVLMDLFWFLSPCKKDPQKFTAFSGEIPFTNTEGCVDAGNIFIELRSWQKASYF